MTPPLTISIGDIVRMRKPHPCGGDTWRVVRVGADIGLRCQTCERRVLLRRASFERQLRQVVQRSSDTPASRVAE